jgi:hypothetical protein
MWINCDIIPSTFDFYSWTYNDPTMIYLTWWTSTLFFVCNINLMTYCNCNGHHKPTCRFYSGYNPYNPYNQHYLFGDWNLFKVWLLLVLGIILVFSFYWWNIRPLDECDLRQYVTSAHATNPHYTPNVIENLKKLSKCQLRNLTSEHIPNLTDFAEDDLHGFCQSWYALLICTVDMHSWTNKN